MKDPASLLHSIQCLLTVSPSLILVPLPLSNTFIFYWSLQFQKLALQSGHVSTSRTRIHRKEKGRQRSVKKKIVSGTVELFPTCMSYPSACFCCNNLMPAYSFTYPKQATTTSLPGDSFHNRRILSSFHRVWVQSPVWFSLTANLHQACKTITLWDSESSLNVFLWSDQWQMKGKINGMTAWRHALSQNQFEKFIFKDTLCTKADIHWFTDEAREMSESTGCHHI